jgi:hypothetical protein
MSGERGNFNRRDRIRTIEVVNAKITSESEWPSQQSIRTTVGRDELGWERDQSTSSRIQWTKMESGTIMTGLGV